MSQIINKSIEARNQSNHIEGIVARDLLDRLPFTPNNVDAIAGHPALNQLNNGNINNPILALACSIKHDRNQFAKLEEKVGNIEAGGGSGGGGEGESPTPSSINYDALAMALNLAIGVGTVTTRFTNTPFSALQIKTNGDLIDEESYPLLYQHLLNNGYEEGVDGFIKLEDSRGTVLRNVNEGRFKESEIVDYGAGEYSSDEIEHFEISLMSMPVKLQMQTENNSFTYSTLFGAGAERVNDIGGFSRSFKKRELFIRPDTANPNESVADNRYFIPHGDIYKNTLINNVKNYPSENINEKLTRSYQKLKEGGYTYEKEMVVDGEKVLGVAHNGPVSSIEDWAGVEWVYEYEGRSNEKETLMKSTGVYHQIFTGVTGKQLKTLIEEAINEQK